MVVGRENVFYLRFEVRLFELDLFGAGFGSAEVGFEGFGFVGVRGIGFSKACVAGYGTAYRLKEMVIKSY